MSTASLCCRDVTTADVCACQRAHVIAGAVQVRLPATFRQAHPLRICTQDLPTLNGCSRDGILRLCAWRTTLGASSARGALLPFPRTCAGGARAGTTLCWTALASNRMSSTCARMSSLGRTARACRRFLSPHPQEEPHPETDSGSPLGSGWSGRIDVVKIVIVRPGPESARGTQPNYL
jgi:hypothetical protein